MTEPPIDGPEPELTRAQRRAQRSRRAKRSQRNSPTRAVRRDPGPAPDPDPDPVTAEDAPARDARVPSGPPAAGEPEPEPGPVWPPPVPPA
ncbi:MAG: hypothetical protein ACXVLO_14365, partial [Acidimicrobiia bacterium]